MSDELAWIDLSHSMPVFAQHLQLGTQIAMWGPTIQANLNHGNEKWPS